MKQQHSDFGEHKPKPAGSTKLAITVKGQDELTKRQKEFNRLTKKIELLRKELTTTALTLDAHLSYYGQHIRPLELELAALNSAHLKLLAPYIKENKLLTKKERKAIKEYASVILQELIAITDDEPDEDLKAMFEILYDKSFDEMRKEELASVTEEMEDMFTEMGYDVDLSDLNPNMKPEDVAAKLAELQEKFDAHQDTIGSEQTGKKKTKKQLAQELKERQMEEVRKKSINSIYRQLAKVLHPDLEHDPATKKVKEDVMKQLTAAYEVNDLHTLLRLEIEWMEKQEKDINTLTDDKLSVYNNVLKEQIENLQEEVYTLADHPRYMPLLRFMDYEELVRSKTLVHKKKQITGMIRALSDTIRLDLGGSAPLRYIRELAQYQLRESQQQQQMEKYFNDLMNF